LESIKFLVVGIVFTLIILPVSADVASVDVRLIHQLTGSDISAIGSQTLDCPSSCEVAADCADLTTPDCDVTITTQQLTDAMIAYPFCAEGEYTVRADIDGIWEANPIIESDTETDAFNIYWDEDEDFCTSVCMPDGQDVSWNGAAAVAGYGCCGDDVVPDVSIGVTGDCGYRSGDNFCIDAGGWDWKDISVTGLTGIQGDIIRSDCSLGDVIFTDGTDIYRCGPSGGTEPIRSTTLITSFEDVPITIGSYTGDFLCYYDNNLIMTLPADVTNQYNIKECVGGGFSMAAHPGNPTANTGDQQATNIIYDGAFNTPQRITIPSPNEFPTEEGSVFMKIIPTWEWNDSVEHWLFFYGTPDTENFIGILKTATNELRCEVGAAPGSTISDTDYLSTWQPGGTYQVGISWKNPVGVLGEVTKCWGKEQFGFTSPADLPSSDLDFFIAGHPQPKPPADVNVIDFKLYDTYSPSIYYCTSQNTWDTNLDNTDYGLDTCFQAGFTWTGSLCCSEEEDILESYEDPAYASNNPNPGGCWEGEYIADGNPVEDNRVLMYDGEFIGCELGVSSMRIMAKSDSHSTNSLISENFNADDCEVRPGGMGLNSFCDEDGWTAVSFTDSELKYVHDDFILSIPPNETTGCCIPEDECWTGAECQPDQSQEVTLTPFQGKRCVLGDWVVAIERQSWDRSNFGYCLDETDCLVDVLGNLDANGQPAEYFLGNSPQCIFDEQYIGPYYCEAGIWGSRTKLVALQLLDLAESRSPNNFELFCGDWEDFLNLYEYQLPEIGNSVSEYLEGVNCNVGDLDCVNEFCGVEFNNKVFFGTSLNIPINDDDSFLNALGKPKNFCNGVLNNNGFYNECDFGSGIFYNHNTESIIYLPAEGLSSISAGDLITRYQPALSAKLNEVKNFAADSSWSMDSSIMRDFIDETNIFKKLYYVKHSSQELFAFIEENQILWINRATSDFLPVSYLGLTFNNFEVQELFGPDACMLVQGMFDTYDEQCYYDDKEMKYITYFSPAPGSAVVASWADFTSKLRLSVA